MRGTRLALTSSKAVEQILHRLGADAPFQRAVDIRIEIGGGEFRRLVQGEMQSEQRPAGILEAIELGGERRWQLRAPDQGLEGLMHVDGAGHELPRAYRPAVGKHDAAGAAAFDQDAVDRYLRRKRSAGANERLHQAAGQIERAALAELITGFEIEGADHRAHRARLRQRIGQPRAEQRDLEQEQQLDVIVLEQLPHHVERLASADGQEIAADRGPPQQSLAFGLRQRLGVALGDQNLRGDLFGAAVPVAEGIGVFFREPRHVGDGLFAIAAEHQSRAVAVRLTELVARRDVSDAVFKTEVLEPRRLGNVEMIDGMQIVIEARRRHFLGREPAAILQPAVDQQDA